MIISFITTRLAKKTYLRVSDAAVVVSIELLQDLVSFLVGDVESTALNQTLELINRDPVVAIQVE